MVLDADEVVAESVESRAVASTDGVAGIRGEEVAEALSAWP